MKKLHVPSSLNKRLISTLMSNRKADPNESKTFALKSTSEFASRSGDVFGKLQSLEKNHETWVSKNDTIESFDEPEEPDQKPSGKSQVDSTKKDSALVLKSKVEIPPKKEMPARDTEAVFKKPLPVKNWKRKAGGFQNRPKKWTRYSLEDVPLSSDITNATVAFQFLNELSSRKEQKVDTDEEESGDKIVFKKPKQKGPYVAGQFMNELSSRKEQKVDTEEEESGDKVVFKKPKQKGPKFASRIKARVPLAAEGKPESQSGAKEVLNELKPSQANITLAHLDEE